MKKGRTRQFHFLALSIFYLFLFCFSFYVTCFSRRLFLYPGHFDRQKRRHRYRLMGFVHDVLRCENNKTKSRLLKMKINEWIWLNTWSSSLRHWIDRHFFGVGKAVVKRLARSFRQFIGYHRSINLWVVFFFLISFSGNDRHFLSIDLAWLFMICFFYY